MTFHHLTPRDWAKTLAIGLGVAILTAVVMQGLALAGISPLPKPLGLAFAQSLLGEVPLPVGLLFHTVWVMAWAAVYVVLFRDGLTFGRALLLATALWLFAIMVFFPLVGWGFLGLAITPKLILAAAGAHLLFAILLWAGAKSVFQDRASTVTSSRQQERRGGDANVTSGRHRS
jgi:hypothetical protein|tara:strand:+ start:1056 stop:1577 length:522 start_codon:yes stop_codon:yes gene_type:complete